MGEVYRARDIHLGRDVALKVLPAAVAGDPKRLARFEREAQLLGSVAHPNILSLHDFGESGGIAFAIFELLKGRTLRERLKSGPLPSQRAVEIAAGIGRGLAAAHAKKIVHRDVKPENIFVLTGGGVKVLDFGLARQVAPTDSGEVETSLETDELLTGAGAVVGTVGYLSPEQVRGETVDHRSDIFALGCVLYEMLSGRRPFTGETSHEVLTAVLRQEAPHLDPRPMLPGLAPIVHRCLEKDPGRRFQSASDLAFALESLSGLSSPDSGPAIKAEGAPVPPLRGRLVFAATMIAAAGLGFALAGLLARPGGRGNAAEFERITFRRGSIFQARFVPGGSRVFYSASWDGNPVEIFETIPGQAGARSLNLAPATLMSVSKQGELAVALSPRFPFTYYQPGRLARLPATGGVPPRELLDHVNTADWDPVTGELVVARSLDDGTTWLEWPLGTRAYHSTGRIGNLRVAPDGQRLAFFEYSSSGVTLVVLDHNLEQSSLDKAWNVISGGIAWTPDNKEVWFTASTDWSPTKLWAYRPGGSLRMVLNLPGGMRLQDVAGDGRVLLSLWNYRISLHAGEMQSTDTRDLSWFGWSFVSDLSADGKTLLFSDLPSERPAETDSWFVRPFEGGPATEIASGDATPLSFRGGKLSPDGRSAAIPSADGRVITIEPLGAGEPYSVQLPKGMRSWGPIAWRHDSRGFLFVGSRDGGTDKLFEQMLDGAPPRSLRPSAAYGLVLSPDGSWTAGVLDRFRLRLVQHSGKHEREITADAPLGHLIRWSADGTGIFFYRQGEVPGAIYRLELETGHVSLLRRLMPPDPAGVWRVHPVTVSADGSRYAYSASRWMSDLYLFRNLLDN